MVTEMGAGSTMGSFAESSNGSIGAVSSASSVGDFVEEIDVAEIQMLKTVGQGAFGVVNHARWRGIDVAVKLIQGEQERKAFQMEVRQLSRVSHPNIVRLHGAGAFPKGPMVLLMEYAEGGSLYNVLHGETPQGVRAKYTAAHAMSWALQTARGVAYLHGMTPKPVVHRDLKPPNLLLIDEGRILKICDFGTACECQTHMTNAKGSAAWMAPEVFEGSEYTEKCDIFSWGIILWEVLTRMKPFDDIGGSAYRIMWAVHEGQRPHLIHNCPEPIENLMVSCWDSKPSRRPSMDEVVAAMTNLQRFFPGHDEPLQYCAGSDVSHGDSTYDTEYSGCGESSNSWATGASSGRFCAFPGSSDEMKREEDKFLTRLTSDQGPDMGLMGTFGALRIEVGTTRYENLPSNALVSAVNSATSEEEMLVLNEPFNSREMKLSEGEQLAVPAVPGHQKRHSADFSKMFEPPPSAPVIEPPKLAAFSDGRALGHRRSSSYGSDSTAMPAAGSRPVGGWPAWVRPIPTQPITAAAYETQTREDFSVYGGDFIDEAYLMLPPDLLPIPPDDGISESVDVYEDHRRLAMDYVKVNAEIRLLESSIRELRRELREEEEHSTVLNPQGRESLMKEFQKLLDEKDSVESVYKCLEKQLEAAKNGKL